MQRSNIKSPSQSKWLWLLPIGFSSLLKLTTASLYSAFSNQPLHFPRKNGGWNHQHQNSNNIHSHCFNGHRTASGGVVRWQRLENWCQGTFLDTVKFDSWPIAVRFAYTVTTLQPFAGNVFTFPCLHLSKFCFHMGQHVHHHQIYEEIWSCFFHHLSHEKTLLLSIILVI